VVKFKRWSGTYSWCFIEL